MRLLTQLFIKFSEIGGYAVEICVIAGSDLLKPFRGNITGKSKLHEEHSPPISWFHEEREGGISHLLQSNDAFRFRSTTISCAIIGIDPHRGAGMGVIPSVAALPCLPGSEHEPKRVALVPAICSSRLEKTCCFSGGDNLLLGTFRRGKLLPGFARPAALHPDANCHRGQNQR